MNWIFLAVLSYVIWSPTNIVDKILTTRYYKNYLSLASIATIISAIFMLSYIGLVHGFKLLSGYLIVGIHLISL